MTVLLLMILILLELIHCLEIQKFFKLWKETQAKPKQITPPKARSSFILKRMEERIKEALYE